MIIYRIYIYSHKNHPSNGLPCPPPGYLGCAGKAYVRWGGDSAGKTVCALSISILLSINCLVFWGVCFSPSGPEGKQFYPFIVLNSIFTLIATAALLRRSFCRKEMSAVPADEVASDGEVVFVEK